MKKGKVHFIYINLTNFIGKRKEREIYMTNKILNGIRKIKPLNILVLTLAGIINAFGVTLFLAPVKLYDSGISGTSMLISQVTPEWCSLSLILIVLNIPIFLFGLKREGASFTFYSIYTVIIYSVSAYLITDVLPIDVSLVSPLAGTDLFLCAIFGGVISGCGSGLALRFGGAMDGMEIIAVVFAKKLNLSIGTFVMIFNVILYIICGLVINSWVLPLYSIVTYAAALKTIDTKNINERNIRAKLPHIVEETVTVVSLFILSKVSADIGKTFKRINITT